MKHKLTLLLLMVAPLFAQAQAQNNNTSEHALKVNLGYGIYQNIDDYDFLGSGLGFWLAYEHSLRQRLKIVPTFGANFMDGRYVEEDGVQAFQVLSINTAIHYDVIQLQHIKGIIGVGLQVNQVDGVMGSGGTLKYLGPSKYKSETMLSLAGSLGVRYDGGGKIMIDILSVNATASPKFYYFVAQSGISIKL